MRILTTLPQGDLNEVPGAVAAAEAAGFDGVMTMENRHDPFLALAVAATASERVELATAVAIAFPRSPMVVANTCWDIQNASRGRFVLGIGPSGPQVVEGWYGVPYGKPMARTREYVAVVRKVFAREAPLEHRGEHYRIPAAGPGTTGLGKPLKSILHPEPGLKIFTGAFTPAGLRTAAELADGVFPVFMNPDRFDLFSEALAEGFGKAGGGKSLAGFEIAPFVPVHPGDDLEACRNEVKSYLALYVGGMGARGRNFYNDYAKRLGYEAAAVEIQDLFLDGKRREAAAAVPDALVDDLALVGPRDRIRDRLGAWKAAAAQGRVTTLIAKEPSAAAVRLLAEELL